MNATRRGNWTSSRISCEKDGGQLAMGKTPGELQEIASLSPNSRGKGDCKGCKFGTWLGGRKNEDGVWYWPDGDEIKDVKWGEESGSAPHCAMLKNGELLPRYCGKVYNPMCQQKTNTIGEQGSVTLTFTGEQLFERNLKTNKTKPKHECFEIWYQQQINDDDATIANYGSFELSWYIADSNGLAVNMSKDVRVLNPLPLPTTPLLKSQMLEKLVALASQARLEGLQTDMLFSRAFEDKESMLVNGTIGECSKGQMVYRRTDLDKITLGLSKSNSTVEHVPTIEDIENGLHLYAIFRFCPKEASKIGQFLELLVSTASPRTILLSVVNSLKSNMLTKTDRVLLSKFYEALDKILDLRFGKILLALSSPTQLEAMLAQDLPYIMPYSLEIKECLKHSKCEKMIELLETIGNN